MYFILFLISILVIILVLIAIVPLQILFNSDENIDFHMEISWLKPLFKAIILNKDTNIFLTIYLFNKKISTKPLKAKKEKNSNNYKDKFYYLKQLKPYYSHIDASYGFQDPSTTGIIFGIVNSLTKFLNLRNINNEANFTSEENYFNIDGIIKLNIATTIIKLLKSYRKSHQTIYQK
ncbi:hypothetical protein SH2C18_40650 [Clostridium sediminicola]|uniref:DUF2953 domain-containing protein n=1 Tax=Clostridium sediminicola TaxID=3114879 RepID=UPI0031F1F9A1